MWKVSVANALVLLPDPAGDQHRGKAEPVPGLRQPRPVREARLLQVRNCGQTWMRQSAAIVTQSIVIGVLSAVTASHYLAVIDTQWEQQYPLLM
jgi:hypothetical protein